MVTNDGRPLPRGFYLQDTPSIARGLLGQRVVRRMPDGETRSGLIVETEAYLTDDPAMYAYRTPSARSRVLFGPPGHAFLYRAYRVHVMFNVACAPEGVVESVLIRALEPGEGVAAPTNGPGKLTAALGLTPSQSGLDVTDPAGELKIVAHDFGPFKTVTATRIGLSRGADLPLRFYIQGNPCVSRRASPQ